MKMPRLRKEENKKEDDTKKNHKIAHKNWNDWKFQIH